MIGFVPPGYRISKNPYWFNHQTGQVVTTPGEHHSRVFSRDPGALGLTAEDVATKLTGEEQTMAFASVMLERGWCRIDIVDQEPDTASINAPSIEAAEAAIRLLPDFSPTPVQRLIIVIAPFATKDGKHVAVAELSGGEVLKAFDGLAPWFGSVAATSKMKAAPGRRPFGHGGR